ncbi:hypothetical protein ACWD4J_11775 [Streptomyces sp. NPDC002577]
MACAGDPTAAALLTAGTRLGLDLAVLDRELPRVDEIPFDSGRKRMPRVHRRPDGGAACHLQGGSGSDAAPGRPDRSPGAAHRDGRAQRTPRNRRIPGPRRRLRRPRRMASRAPSLASAMW